MKLEGTEHPTFPVMLEDSFWFFAQRSLLNMLTGIMWCQESNFSRQIHLPLGLSLYNPEIHFLGWRSSIVVIGN